MDNLLLFWDFGALLAWLGAILLFWSIWSGRARGRKRCPKCRYDMSHPGDDPLRCPECGNAARKERHLLGTIPNWRQFRVAVVMLLAAGLWLAYPRFQRNGWMAFVSDTVLLLGMTRDIDSWAADALAGRLSGTGDKFNEESMWGWQWRFMAWQASNSLKIGDVSWYSSRQLELLLGAPSPHDRAAFSYLEDLLSRQSTVRPTEVLWRMKLIAEHAVEPETRQHFIELAMGMVPKGAASNTPDMVISSLGQPWPEAEMAVPLLVEMLELDRERWDVRRWLIVNTLQRMGPHGRGADDAVIELFGTTDPATNQRIAVFETLAAIDPGNPRLRNELLKEFAHEWADGQLAAMDRDWSNPEWVRVRHQLAAVRIWLRSEFDPGHASPTLFDFVHADPYFFRFFRRDLDRFIVLGDEGARLLMHMIEASPPTFREGSVQVEAHIALRRFPSIPEDVRERLNIETESDRRVCRERAESTLRSFDSP